MLRCGYGLAVGVKIFQRPDHENVLPAAFCLLPLVSLAHASERCWELIWHFCVYSPVLYLFLQRTDSVERAARSHVDAPHASPHHHGHHGGALQPAGSEAGDDGGGPQHAMGEALTCLPACAS